MPQLHILLFGPPRVEYHGEAIRMTTRKSLALLAYLSVTAEAHSRDALSILLWPEADSESSRVSLRHTLWRLRRSLGDGCFFADRQNVALNWAADMRVDVRELENRLVACRFHGHGDEPVCAAFARGGHSVPGRVHGRPHAARQRPFRRVAALSG